MSGIGILGGTFNPVHVGHLRYALEAAECLELDKVLLTPGAVPPHKSANTLLSFELRAYMAEVAVATIPELGLNCLECELEGPSYTYNSLQEWQKRNPGKDLPYFLLGLEDFKALRTWFRGLELPSLATLVVASRAGSDLTEFKQSMNSYWPGFMEQGQLLDYPQQKRIFDLPDGGRVIYLDIPRLDISSSMVRAYWLQGRNLTGLVPSPVVRVLEQNREQVIRVWSQDQV